MLRNYENKQLKGTQPDPFFHALHGNLQSCVTQSGNMFMFAMHNPVYFIDPSGLSAMSVRHAPSPCRVGVNVDDDVISITQG